MILLWNYFFNMIIDGSRQHSPCDRMMSFNCQHDDRRILSNPFHCEIYQIAASYVVCSMYLLHYDLPQQVNHFWSTQRNQTIKMCIFCHHLSVKKQESQLHRYLPADHISSIFFIHRNSLFFFKAIILESLCCIVDDHHFTDVTQMQLPQNNNIKKIEIRGVDFLWRVFYKCFHTLCHNYTIKSRQPSQVGLSGVSLTVHITIRDPRVIDISRVGTIFL